VRAYFAGIEADSYDQIRGTTVDQARSRTDELIAEIVRQEGEVGVDFDLRVTALNITLRPVDGSVRPVEVHAVVAAYLHAGLLHVKLREIHPGATFSVARVAGGVRIVELQGEVLP
jgi:hypothetical protein